MFIIHQAEIETITQTSDQVIHDFAFFAFSSSHHDNKYIIPLIIKAITAITATNCITCHIILVMNSKPILFEIDGAVGTQGLVSTQPGNQIQLTSGAQANAKAYNHVNSNVTTIDIFFNIIIFYKILYISLIIIEII